MKPTTSNRGSAVKNVQREMMPKKPGNKTMLKYALPPLVTTDSKILILGTIPGERAIALQQYYGNNGNHFWKILFAVFGVSFSIDYEERKALLHRHKIALWNTLASCEREGSRDDTIKKAVVNDFKQFFDDHPGITHVFFESISAARLYSRYAYKATDIEYITLPSTSGLNSRIPYREKLKFWQQIKEQLNRTG